MPLSISLAEILVFFLCAQKRPIRISTTYVFFPSAINSRGDKFHVQQWQSHFGPFILAVIIPVISRLGTYQLFKLRYWKTLYNCFTLLLNVICYKKNRQTKKKRTDKTSVNDNFIYNLFNLRFKYVQAHEKPLESLNTHN